MSGDHTKDLAMMVWFAARGATNAGQWPGDPDDFAKQIKARDEFEAWWRGPRLEARDETTCNETFETADPQDPIRCEVRGPHKVHASRITWGGL